jgi:phosphatidylserine/phosphatidylglycerophosphate/cardiolipin synthase-like enzyme
MKSRLFRQSLILMLGLLCLSAIPASAQDRMCDPGDEDCRSILINYIRTETVGIDVAFWFMEDARYTNELIKKFQAGVPVRVLMDPRANPTYDLNAQRLSELQAAGIPMRKRLTSAILHWKMMLFHGQNVVEFSGANYSADAWRPATATPYENYTDEGIIFTSDTAITNSFRTKFDDHWVDTTDWANYANITQPLTRKYDIFPKDPSLNFPPAENYRSRAVKAYNAEKRKIDVIMYRITDRSHSDAMLAAVARGVPVRLITEPVQYRLVDRMWHSWNVDRMYMGGVQIKHRAHAGLNHQKSVILYDQNGTVAGDQSMVIFGSSNWTSPSAASQVEHNMFTSKPDLVSWYVNQFERKWNNTGGIIENADFVPLPPDAPINPSPATNATGVATTLTLKWFGGPWAHLYDLYIDTNSSFTNPTVFTDLAETPSKTETSTFSYALPAPLVPGTTYYWKVVGKTMALKTKTSSTWTFTTAGQAPPPPTTGSAEVVLYAGKATTKVGAWQVESDSTAAGGVKMRNPNLNAPKIVSASADPASYFEMTFTAEAGVGYHLWIRGRADSNNWANDSVFVQFSNSVTNTGAAAWRTNTTSAAEVNLENCNSCGVAGWGWQDNAYGVGANPPLIYFASDGPVTIRVQPREDGLSIDQIVLSHTTFVSTSPGSLKNDTQILEESDGSGGEPPPPPPPPPVTGDDEVVLFAARNPVLGDGWVVETDPAAADGVKLRHPNGGAPKLTAPLSNPTNYFELTFNALAGRPYRLWLRGKADSNNWANDSVFVQFDRSVDANGTPIWRIDSSSATDVNLEDCSGCGLAAWGWQDNGWGIDALGPVVYFEADGPQRIRIQTREDGLAIDQVVLSAVTYLNSAPGALKNDTTILPRTQ